MRSDPPFVTLKENKYKFYLDKRHKVNQEYLNDFLERKFEGNPLQINGIKYCRGNRECKNRMVCKPF